MNFPKVLIVNQPFNSHTGGGITLSNLFEGWDNDKIAVVCHNYLLENTDVSTCNTYYQWGHKEHKFIFPFNIFKRKHYSGLLKFEENKVKSIKIEKSKARVTAIMDYFYPILKFFGVFNNISRIELSPEFCNWLKDFNPDVIYSQATSREDVKSILLIKSFLKKPLIFHMMDDWPSMMAEKGFLKTRTFKRNDLEFRKLLNEADILMSISEEMANEYKIRYNKTFVTFHNPIDIEYWGKHQRTDYQLGDHPTILYAGRLGLGIDVSLQIIAKAITQVNFNLNLAIKFILQTKEIPEWISDYDCVKHTSFVEYSELPKIFAETDLLILPYDFSPQSIQFIGYSMPTKATEYMISGTPIIIFAPEKTAIVNYAKKRQWAKIVTENNVDKLSEAITDIVTNQPLRELLAQNAIKVAQENHSSKKVRANFKEIICSLK